MKKLLLSLTVLLAGAGASARDMNVGPLEGTISTFVTMPVGSYYGATRHVGLGGLSADIRYNFPKMPLDCGVFIQGDGNYWKFDNNDGSSYNQHNTSLTARVVAHWNFNQGRKVNPFVGLGIGAAWCHPSIDGYEPYFQTPVTNDAYAMMAAFSPRVGVEIWQRLNVALRANIIKKGFNSIDLSVGITIGGKAPKK